MKEWVMIHPINVNHACGFLFLISIWGIIIYVFNGNLIYIVVKYTNEIWYNLLDKHIC